MWPTTSDPSASAHSSAGDCGSVGCNLLVGYFATFGTLLIILVWVDNEITGILFRSLCTIPILGILIGIGAGLNVLLRLFDRDVAERSFWIISTTVFSAWSVYFLLVAVLLEQHEMFPIFWS